mmetsp:Transcript_118500/g.185991  ORF Transcript_118500/g.185991 Transcript_118500/m.185991 type:complete len:204 (+) Transcript_118500:869-1480(+)
MRLRYRRNQRKQHRHLHLSDSGHISLAVVSPESEDVCTTLTRRTTASLSSDTAADAQMECRVHAPRDCSQYPSSSSVETPSNPSHQAFGVVLEVSILQMSMLPLRRVTPAFRGTRRKEEQIMTMPKVHLEDPAVPHRKRGACLHENSQANRPIPPNGRCRLSTGGETNTCLPPQLPAALVRASLTEMVTAATAGKYWNFPQSC